MAQPLLPHNNFGDINNRVSIIDALTIPNKDTIFYSSPTVGLITVNPTDGLLYFYNGTSWQPSGAGGSGTLTSITIGTGLVGSPNPITVSGSISMPNVGTPGTYGDATHIPRLTTDSQGRITSVSLVAIGSGAITSISVNTINGFSGTTTSGPASSISLSTTASGVLKGSFGAIVPAIDTDITSKLLTGFVSTPGTVSSSDSILTAIEKLDASISSIIGGASYQGTWDASTNTPTLTSGVGTTGHYYIVSVSGTTTLDGISSWAVNDIVIFGIGVWQKLSGASFSVTSVNGLTGAVPLTGTSNRITVSASNVFDIAATYIGQSSITTLGTISTGVWQGTSISTTYTDAKIKTVTGTLNRLAITGTSTDPVFNIDAAYVGQTSINTLGTISTGTWNGTTIDIAHGGTNATTATAAINNLLPSQTGNSGKVLGTNGTNVSWVAGTGTVTSIATDSTLTGGPITSSGTLGINLGNPNNWTIVQNFDRGIAVGLGGSVDGAIAIFNSTNTNPVTIKPTIGGSAWDFHLPPNAGSLGYRLTTDGAGNTSWQPGTAAGVTSVDVSASGALSSSGGPIVSSGVVTLSWTGTSSQFVKGNGSLDSTTYLSTTSATSTYVPYSGATGDVNIGSHAYITKGSFTVDYNTGQAAAYIYSNAGITGVVTVTDSTGSNLWLAQVDKTGTNLETIYQTSGGSITITPATLSGNWSRIEPNKSGTYAMTSDLTGGTVTSVALTVPAAFSVSGSPITTSGTLAVTGAGTTDQYVRGDGTLGNFAMMSGAGGVTFYLNGNTSQGTIGGNTYYQLSSTPASGTAANFSNSGTSVLARFITDINSPNKLVIPAGIWQFQVYLSASSSGGAPTISCDIQTYNGTSFTTIATSISETINNGTTTDLYTFNASVPQTSIATTDRIALVFNIVAGTRTITLHTEDSTFSSVITSFPRGISDLNGLTTSVQSFATGTSGTDFVISSSTSTHTFNLPIASATNTGKLSNTDWSTFNSKVTSVSGTSNRITSTGGTTPVIDISAAYVGQTSITTLGTITTGTLSTGAIIAGVTMTLGSDATGDMYYRNSSGVLTRIAAGAQNTLLRMGASSVPTWSTETWAVPGTSGNVLVSNGTNWTSSTSTGITTTGTMTSGTLSTGYVIAGVTMTLGSDANYDTYYRNSSGVLTRLANGTTGQAYVATSSSAPSWGRLTSAGLPTDTAYLDVQQSWTKGQAFSKFTLTDASTIAIDLSNGNNFVVVLGGNRTLGVPTNILEAQSGWINVWQDITGSRTLAYSWPYTFSGGSAPTLTTSKLAMDKLGYMVDYYKTSSTITATNATPGVFTWTGHGLISGQHLQFTAGTTTTPSLNTTYWVTVIDANTFNISTSLANAQAGTLVATSGISGNLTATALGISIIINTDSR